MSTLFWYRPNKPILGALVPGSEDVVEGNSTQSTLRAWEAECLKRGIVLDNAIRVFNDCACRALPSAMRAKNCSLVDENSPELLQRHRLWDFEAVNRFLKTMWGWIGSRKMVSQEVAEARASVCALCPLNQTAHGLGGCPGCRQLATEMFEWVGNRTTSNSHLLKTCGHCGCQNSVSVWIPMDVLSQYPTAEPPPSWCWKIQTET